MKQAHFSSHQHGFVGPNRNLSAKTLLQYSIQRLRPVPFIRQSLSLSLFAFVLFLSFGFSPVSLVTISCSLGAGLFYGFFSSVIEQAHGGQFDMDVWLSQTRS